MTERLAEHSIIDMSTPPDDENGLDTSLWCACECGWSAGPFEDELFAAEAYADHKLDAITKERAMDPSEVVVLPRAALFEFFGKMALPPWTDEKGKHIGSRIECAPIASEIAEWVEQHELPLP